MQQRGGVVVLKQQQQQKKGGGSTRKKASSNPKQQQQRQPYVIQGQQQQIFQPGGGGIFAPPLIQPQQLARNAPYPLIPPPNVLGNRVPGPNIIYLQRPKERHHMRYRIILFLIIAGLIIGVVIYATIGTSKSTTANQAAAGGHNLSTSSTHHHTNSHTHSLTNEITNAQTISLEIVTVNKEAIQGTMIAIGGLLGLYVVGIFFHYLHTSMARRSKERRLKEEADEDRKRQWRYLHRGQPVPNIDMEI